MHDLDIRLQAVESRVLALSEEMRDIRADAVGPVEKLAQELTELRHRQDRHKELLRRMFADFTAKYEKLEQQVKAMAATLADVTAALTKLDADVDQLIASHSQSLDGVLAQAQATDTKVQAALTPAAPAPATPA